MSPEAGVELGRLDARARDGRLGSLPVGVALATIAIVATGFYAPKFGGDFTLADVLIMGMVVASALRLRDFLADDVVRRLSVPVTLIVTGGLVGAFHTGLQGWIAAELLRDAAVFLAFVSAVHLWRRGGPQAVRLGFVALGVTIPVVVVQLLVSHGGALRAAGTFPNPNIPAHLLAGALIAWTQAPVPPRWRRAGYLVGAVGMLATASFGSVLQLVVGLGYLLVAAVRRDPERARANLPAVAGVVAVVVLAAGAYGLVSRGGSGLNQRRFDRSSSTRLGLWREGLRAIPDAPLGVGPGSARSLGIDSLDKQLHNEPLAFLVERGALGLAGLLLLWGALWKLGRPGGAARALVLAYVVASIFRDTLHYRHFWLLLALVVVADELAARRGPGSSRLARP